MGAGTVVGQGRGVVVASRLIGATEVLARAVVERGIGVVIGGDLVQAARHHTGPVLDGRERVVVAGRRVGTSRKHAGPVILGGLRVEVLRSADGAARNDARAIIEVGALVVVGRSRVRATRENAGIVVRVGRRVVVEGRGIGTTEELARAIVLSGIRIEVVCGKIRASCDGTAAIVVGGSGIVVVGFSIGTPACRARRSRQVGRGEARRGPHVVVAIAMDEDLVVQRTAEHARGGELAEQHGQVVTSDAIHVDVGHKPSAPHGIVHHDVAPIVKSDDPVLVRALGTLNGPFPSHRIRRALNADGQPGVESELWECAEKQGIHTAGKRATEQVLVECGGRGHLQRQLLIAVHTGEHVVDVRNGREDAPRRGAREVARGVVGHALEAKAIAGLIGLVIKAVQSSLPFFGTGAVLTAAVVFRHGRVVVAGRRVQATAELVLVANAVAIGVVEAHAVTIDVVRRRIGARTVVHIGASIKVAGIAIRAAPILAGPVIGRRQYVEVDRSRVGTTRIQAAAIRQVGFWIEVVRLGIRAARVGARPVVHVRVGIIVGSRSIGTACILARAVVHIGPVVVIHRTAVETAGEQAGPIVVVGSRVVVGRSGIRTTWVQARAVIGVGGGVVIRGARVETAFQNARPVIGVGGRIVVGRRGVGTTRENARAIVGVGLRIEVARHGHRAAVVDAGAVVHVGLRVEVVGLRVETAEVHAPSVIGVGCGVKVVGSGVRAAIVDAGTVVGVGLRVVVVCVGISATGQDAAPVVLVGRRVVVVGQRVGATGHHTGAVVDIGPVIVVQGVRIRAPHVFASAILILRIGVIVVGRGIGTAARIAATIATTRGDDHGLLGLAESVGGERESRALLIAAESEREDLDGKGSADHPIGGELRHQDAHLAVRHPVEVGRCHKPSAADDVVDADFSTGVKTGDPVLVRALRALDVAVAWSRRAVQTDGHPGVVSEVRECAQQQRVDARAESAAKQVLVKRCRGRDHHGIGRIAKARAQEVARIVEHDIHAVSRHASEVARGVRGDPIHVQRVAGRVIGEGQRRQRVTEHIGRVGGSPSGARAVITGAVLLRGVRIEVAG